MLLMKQNCTKGAVTILRINSLSLDLGYIFLYERSDSLRVYGTAWVCHLRKKRRHKLMIKSCTVQVLIFAIKFNKWIWLSFTWELFLYHLWGVKDFISTLRWSRFPDVHVRMGDRNIMLQWLNSTTFLFCLTKMVT